MPKRKRDEVDRFKASIYPTDQSASPGYRCSVRPAPKWTSLTPLEEAHGEYKVGDMVGLAGHSSWLLLLEFRRAKRAYGSDPTYALAVWLYQAEELEGLSYKLAGGRRFILSNHFQVFDSVQFIKLKGYPFREVVPGHILDVRYRRRRVQDLAMRPSQDCLISSTFSRSVAAERLAIDKSAAFLAEADRLEQINQQQSPLLGLPSEIRVKIFGYVLGGNSIQIYQEGDIKDKVATEWRVHTPEEILPYGDVTYYCDASRKLTPLHLVCRGIRKDTAILPYRLNIFCFRSIYPFRSFWTRLSTRQRDALRYLSFEYAPLEEIFDNIKNLEVLFLDKDGSVVQDHEAHESQHPNVRFVTSNYDEEAIRILTRDVWM